MPFYQLSRDSGDHFPPSCSPSLQNEDDLNKKIVVLSNVGEINIITILRRHYLRLRWVRVRGLTY